MERIKIIETPRDGMQGLENWVPTGMKISYINSLLRVGFDTVEVGSFVSHEAIPQMKDTPEVLKGIDTGKKESKVMVLAGNTRGGREAVTYDMVDQVLYPFSVSPTFLQKNLNSDFNRAKETMAELRKLCDAYGKDLVIYITMGFGNPYGDPWSLGILNEWVAYLHGIGRRIIPLSDIMGTVEPETISLVYSDLTVNFPDVEFGIHLHTTPGNWRAKVNAAWEAGVRRFDSVTGGFGGCPMASDHLVSNLDTFDLVRFCEEKGIHHGIDLEQLQLAASFSPD